MSGWARQELDYKQEARNLDDFVVNFKDDKYVKIPNCYKCAPSAPRGEQNSLREAQAGGELLQLQRLLSE